MADPELLKFYLGGLREQALLEFFEIKHSALSQVWRITKNYPDGVTIRHEDGRSYNYEYWPAAVSFDGRKVDLDSGLRLDLGDLGELMPKEIDRIIRADSLGEKPLLLYRIYSGDNLDEPLSGPITYEIHSVSRNAEGSSLEAKAPLINTSGTGLIYQLDGPFEPLRDYLYS